MSPDDENTDIKVEQYKIKNTLKEKLGSMRVITNEDGELDPEQINEADELITDLCKTCLDDIGDNLEKLCGVWTEMQKVENADTRQQRSEEIFTLSHEIKDIASLCGYTLTAHFAESLRDYIAETALNLKNQKIIIQAHVDAMTIVHRKNIKEDGGPAAEELKKMVKIAIEKYH